MRVARANNAVKDAHIAGLKRHLVCIDPCGDLCVGMRMGMGVCSYMRWDGSP